MGGMGSGRRAWGAKRWTVEEALALDVRRLARAAGLAPGKHQHRWPSLLFDGAVIAYEVAQDGGTLALAYHLPADPLRAVLFGETGRDVRQTVSIERTPCRFGGDRPWFACPACGRRVAVLYHLAALADDFRCRLCLGLAYSSTREAPARRPLRKADRLRADLGGPPGLGRVPPQPDWMGWRAYMRQVDRIRALDGAYAVAVAPPDMAAFGRRLRGEEA